MRRFSLERAILDAWPVFLEAARSGRTVTYSELAGRAGPPLTRRHVHRQLLTPLSARCRQAGLPDLSALVVRKDTGRPGGGWFDPRDGEDPDGAWVAALEACFAYFWPSTPDPRLLAGPSPTTGPGVPPAEGSRRRTSLADERTNEGASPGPSGRPAG